MSKRLYYITDALCGWCYGFGPVIKQFVAKYGDELTVRVVAGGMITGQRIGPIGEVAPYIKEAHKTVEQRCGVTFGDKFLNDVLEEGSTVFTSVPPAVALAAFRSLAPDHQVAFAGDQQTAIYYDGADPADFTAYADYAVNYGVDRAAFLAACAGEDARRDAERDFAMTAQLGVSGFPTVLVVVGDQPYVIGRGYLPLEALEANYRQVAELANT